jgi:DNA repair protein RecO (recombination protein O)
MSPRSFEAEAIVLDSRDHGEADLIVTFFTLEKGRVSGIAKGAKRSKKRFVNKLELFSFLHITYSESLHSSLLFIHEAELHASFLNLRSDFTRYATASTLREFLLMAMREGERDETIFRLALWALHSVNEGRPCLCQLTLFLVKFYSSIGYKPEMHACLNCGVAVSSAREFVFSYLSGGLVCSSCATSSIHAAVRLSPGAIRLMQSAQELPLDRLHRLKFSGSILNECLSALHHYGRHLFQRDIASWAMLDPYGKERGPKASRLAQR